MKTLRNLVAIYTDAPWKTHSPTRVGIRDRTRLVPPGLMLAVSKPFQAP